MTIKNTFLAVSSFRFFIQAVFIMPFQQKAGFTIKMRKIKADLAFLFSKFIKREYIPNPKEHLYIASTNICNLACRFCAYHKHKSEIKSQVMDPGFFYEIVERATDFGYGNFGLTPIVGEVFTDKHFLDKAGFLESSRKVRGYRFYTNFTLAGDRIIDFLCEAKKLTFFSISLYGHDEESFIKIARSNTRTYENLVSNLDYLLNKPNLGKLNIEFGLRSYRSLDFKSCRSDLCTIVREIMKKTGCKMHVSHNYNNWGGYIKQEDAQGLDMDIQETPVAKNGPCALIFYKNIVMPDGKINACACRDIGGTMTIGDLTKQTFEQIYSINNSSYINLINNQLNGSFHDICSTCDFYRSIYSYHKVYGYQSLKPLTLNQFLNEYLAK